MSDKLNYTNLVPSVEGFVSITDGVVNIDNKQIQEACFVELGTTLADVKKAYDSVAMVENAIGSVVVDKGQIYLADNKEVETVTGKTKIGEESVTYTVRRDMETRNPQTGAISNHKGALTMRRTINTRASELTDIKTLAKETGIKRL